MAGRKAKTPKVVVKPQYKSATCGLGNAVDVANELYAEGYEIKYCFAVVANNEEGNPVQAVYILAEKYGL